MFCFFSVRLSVRLRSFPVHCKLFRVMFPYTNRTSPLRATLSVGIKHFFVRSSVSGLIFRWFFKNCVFSTAGCNRFVLFNSTRNQMSLRFVVERTGSVRNIFIRSLFESPNAAAKQFSSKAVIWRVSSFPLLGKNPLQP